MFLKGPARTAGVLPGDILLKVDGKAVHNARDISESVADMTPGAKVKLTIRRKLETKTFDVILATQPKDLDVNWEND